MSVANRLTFDGYEVEFTYEPASPATSVEPASPESVEILRVVKDGHEIIDAGLDLELIDKILCYKQQCEDCDNEQNN